MKKIIVCLIITLISLEALSQNPAPMRNGIRFPNATEVTTVTNIPVFNSNNEIKNYINVSNIFPNTLQSITGTNVDLTDPLNPVINIKNLQETTDVSNTTSNFLISTKPIEDYSTADDDVLIPKKYAKELITKTWGYLKDHWSTEPVLIDTSNITIENNAVVNGHVYTYTLKGVTTYRFVPTTYNTTQDAFYSTWNNTTKTLTNLITTRG